ncbi:MAG: hypothetical protein ABI467_22455 [Kofleriaceae bacterium]
MRFALKILIGFVVVWWWLLVDSRDHCPRCGSDLRTYYDHDGPLPHSTRQRACACGWHE